jgi:hypothetical protein
MFATEFTENTERKEIDRYRCARCSLCGKNFDWLVFGVYSDGQND